MNRLAFGVRVHRLFGCIYVCIYACDCQCMHILYACEYELMHVFVHIHIYFHASKLHNEIIIKGAPGSPPPDESSPIGIRAINVPAEETMIIYTEKYPKGFTQPYLWNLPTSIHSVSSAGVSFTLIFLIFLIGLTIGGVVTLLVLKNRKSNLYTVLA